MPRIEFYLLETPLEVLARDILLMEIFLDFELPIRQRANVFLEVFGNSKVQTRTSEYIERMGQKLRALAVSGTSTLNLFDTSYLKYREKDELENIFKTYSRSTPFDIDALRDQRMRGYYEDRFDSRKALYDWDWQYCMHPKASIVHIRLYRDWRESGIAFEFGDQSYTEPNRSMMSYTEGVMKRGKDKGEKKEVWFMRIDIREVVYICITFPTSGCLP
jgi:dynein assembly factor 3